MRARISLNEVLESIRSPKDVSRIIYISNELVDGLTPFNTESYFPNYNASSGFPKRQQSVVIQPGKVAIPDQILNKAAALILLIPIRFAPKQIFMWAQRLIPYLQCYDSYIQSGLMMRLAEAALELNQGENIIHVFELLIKSNPSLFQCPLLYLSACLKKKIYLELILTPRIRLSSLTLFYAGCNDLIFLQYDSALAHFLHSIHLHPIADIMKMAAEHFALTSFLMHFKLDEMKSLLPPKIEISETILLLWSLDNELFFDEFPTIFHDLESEILEERFFRNFIKFSKVSSRISIKKLCEKLDCDDTEKCLTCMEKLKNQGTILFEINDGIIIFDILHMEDKMEKKKQVFLKLKNELYSFIQKLEKGQIAELDIQQISELTSSLPCSKEI